jgi:prophage tail gpP-like protein
MEEGFTEILNEVVQEQSREGITISVKEIKVLNLAGRSQAAIILDCGDISYEEEDKIIESIANKLFGEYPTEYAENSERDSWVDVECDYDMGWRISDGIYDMLI